MRRPFSNLGRQAFAAAMLSFFCLFAAGVGKIAKEWVADKNQARRELNRQKDLASALLSATPREYRRSWVALSERDPHAAVLAATGGLSGRLDIATSVGPETKAGDAASFRLLALAMRETVAANVGD